MLCLIGRRECVQCTTSPSDVAPNALHSDFRASRHKCEKLSFLVVPVKFSQLSSISSPRLF